VDLHVDETLDHTMLTLREYCRLLEEFPLGAPTAASHCVSLSMQPPDVQSEIAQAAARAGVDIVALPQTNLFLQGREFATGMPRGITPVDVLREHGVRVSAGGDNVQDPFNPVGRSDPLETAALMIMAAHQLPHKALELVTSSARSLMGLPPAGAEIGAVADFVVIDARNERQAIADAPLARRTYRRGRLTAVTQVHRSFTDHEAELKW
jgi:cytosine deaminase